MQPKTDKAEKVKEKSTCTLPCHFITSTDNILSFYKYIFIYLYKCIYLHNQPGSQSYAQVVNQAKILTRTIIRQSLFVSASKVQQKIVYLLVVVAVVV